MTNTEIRHPGPGKRPEPRSDSNVRPATLQCEYRWPNSCYNIQLARFGLKRTGRYPGRWTGVSSNSGVIVQSVAQSKGSRGLTVEMPRGVAMGRDRREYASQRRKGLEIAIACQFQAGIMVPFGVAEGGCLSVLEQWQVVRNRCRTKRWPHRSRCHKAPAATVLPLARRNLYRTDFELY